VIPFKEWIVTLDFGQPSRIRKIIITTKTPLPPYILNNFVGWALPNIKQALQDMVCHRV